MSKINAIAICSITAIIILGCLLVESLDTIAQREVMITQSTERLSEAADEISNLNNSITLLESERLSEAADEISNLNNSITLLESESVDYQSTIAQQADIINGLNVEYDILTQSNVCLQEDIAEIQTTVVSLQDTIDRQDELLSLARDMSDYHTDRIQSLERAAYVADGNTRVLESQVHNLEAQVNTKDRVNPSYAQMMSFLASDLTDQNAYIKHENVCWNFAAEVNNNAELAGWRCGYVQLVYENELGHHIVAFDTVDRGLIFIEPQTDVVQQIEIGAVVTGSNIPLKKYEIIW